MCSAGSRIAQFADYETFYPEIQFTTDFDDVLKDPEVDMVVVSAPDAFHVPYAKQILNAGKKKVVGRHKVSFAPAPEDRWGTLVHKSETGETVTEKVPVGCAHYERIYDNLVDAIENGAEKVIKDEEVCKVLEILEAATEVAKSWNR